MTCWLGTGCFGTERDTKTSWWRSGSNDAPGTSLLKPLPPSGNLWGNFSGNAVSNLRLPSMIWPKMPCSSTVAIGSTCCASVRAPPLRDMVTARTTCLEGRVNNSARASATVTPSTACASSTALLPIQSLSTRGGSNRGSCSLYSA